MTQYTDFKVLKIFETAESDYTSQLNLHFIENLTIWGGDKMKKETGKISRIGTNFPDKLEIMADKKLFKSMEIYPW